MSKNPIFTATHIVKTFGPTIALNDVDIAIYPGEIRGFIGENGSGKSTMSQIMTGIYFKNSGTMTFKGELWEPKSMMDAMTRGIGIAVQENGTISGDSVADNMFLCELDKFSGVNFFEKERIVTYSKYFDIDIKEFEEVKDESKRLDINKENVSRLISRAKEIRDKLLLEYASKREGYLKMENEAYDRKLSLLVEELNNNSKKEREELDKESLDSSFKEKKYKYRLSIHKKEYLKKKSIIDLEHQNNLMAIRHDKKAIRNLCSNLILRFKEYLPKSGLRRAQDLFMSVVFGGIVNTKKMNRHTRSILANIGVYNIRPEMPMGMYDIQSRKLVEIAKILNKNPEIFIVDETTTALSEDGRQILYKKMNDLKEAGKAVLFISHDLDEIIERCDTLTVLRDGSIVANLEKSEFDPEAIKKFMIGRELKGDYYRSDFIASSKDKVLLRAKNLSLAGRLNNISLDLHEGEIVGIGGLSDCGMHDFGKVLFGAIQKSSGDVLTGDSLDIEVTSEIVAMKNKIGYLPKDRDVEALALKDSIYNNIAIASINNILKAKIIVSRKEEAEIVKKQVDFLQIKCNSSGDLVNTLSGGNKQKVSLGKWLGNNSRILILDCPTRGVDIGVKQFIYQLMIRLKNEGYAILMISEELPELIGMSDRLLIMRKGMIAHEFKRSADLKQEEIVNYML